MDPLSFFEDENGEVRFLGNNIPTRPIRTTWVEFGSAPDQEIISRTQWNDLVPDEADNYHPYVNLDLTHNQSSIGMCNASSGVRLIECLRAVAGLEHVSLSGGDAYRFISGGVDRGSLLEDGMLRLARVGVLPTSICPYLDWRRDYGQSHVRAQYRVLELAVCPTFDHFYSALIQGWFGVSGVPWYENYRVDSKGWLANPSGRWGGHALMAYKPTRRGNEYAAWQNNSWKKSWGKDGTCAIPETGYNGPVGGWWVGKLVVTETGDIPAPKE